MAIDNQDKQSNPAAPQKVKAATRRIAALELRKQGGSYRQIAAQMRKLPGVSLKYNESAAHSDCMRALKDLLEKQEELAKENLRLDLERLDDMFAKVYANASKGDLYSVNAALGILDRRAKLLNYAGLMAQPEQNLNIDVSKLTNDQLERIANGENPLTVLATSGKG